MSTNTDSNVVAVSSNAKGFWFGGGSTVTETFPVSVWPAPSVSVYVKPKTPVEVSGV